jgi:hypothetical protein
MTRPSSLPRTDQAPLDAILRNCPELAAVTAHVRVRCHHDQPPRSRAREMDAASAAGNDPALPSFVTGLRGDQDAVTAGLTLP